MSARSTRMFLFLGFISSIFTIAVNFPLLAEPKNGIGAVLKGRSSNLVCSPTTWVDIITFYVANYLTHIATIRAYPGEPSVNFYGGLLTALFWPTTGAIRGIDAIIRRSKLKAGSDLQQAAQAGALCMVVRSKNWTPRAGDIVRDVKIPENELGNPQLYHDDGKGNIDKQSDVSGTLPAIVSTYWPVWLDEAANSWWPNVHADGYSISAEKVNGLAKLPAGYELEFLPRDTIVGYGDESSEIQLCSEYSFLTIIISLIQSMYASWTLYQSRGNEVERYGYAAFSLTVAPYAVMSVINLIGNLVTPSYEKLYLVSSEVMEEAKQREGAHFEGVVGHIQTTSDQISGTFETSADGILTFRGADKKLQLVRVANLGEPLGKGENKRNEVQVPFCPRFKRGGKPITDHYVHVNSLQGLGFVVGIIPLAIVGGLSKFKPGRSTTAQRVWTMMWLILGVFLGVFQRVGLLEDKGKPDDEDEEDRSNLAYIIGKIYIFPMILGAPVIGGLVVVGQMLKEFGSCSLAP